MEHVVSFEFPATDTLLVRTRKPDAFYRELPQIVSDTKLEVQGLESPDDSLDAVFRYLVGSSNGFDGILPEGLGRHQPDVPLSPWDPPRHRDRTPGGRPDHLDRLTGR